eukprot:s612_g17.t1
MDFHSVWQAWYLGTWTCILCGRRGTYGTQLGLVTRLVAFDAAAFCVAGVALGDMDFHSVWHLRHAAGRGTYGTQLGLVTRLVAFDAATVCVAGVALGDMDFGLSLCVAGVALTARSWVDMAPKRAEGNESDYSYVEDEEDDVPETTNPERTAPPREAAPEVLPQAAPPAGTAAGSSARPVSPASKGSSSERAPRARRAKRSPSRLRGRDEADREGLDRVGGGRVRRGERSGAGTERIVLCRCRSRFPKCHRQLRPRQKGKASQESSSARIVGKNLVLPVEPRD